jgi:hypothetical protein
VKKARLEAGKNSSFSEEKEAKRLFPVSLTCRFFSEGQCRRHCPTDKSFLVLFSKEERITIEWPRYRAKFFCFTWSRRPAIN